MSDTKQEIRVSDIIEKVKNEMCDHYCKYPSVYQPITDDDFEDEFQRMLDERCESCPLNQL